MTARLDFDTAVFDVDGTLIDSNGAHAETWAQALREHGYVDLRHVRLAVLEVDGTISVIGDEGGESRTEARIRRTRRRPTL